MSKKDRETGSITWFDLTVSNAEQVRDFYTKVVGWKPEPVDMGGYNDFNMNAPGSGKCMAGICHSRGVNAELPPQWMIYIDVANVDDSISKCISLGGKVIVGPKDFPSEGRYCIIQDPAGAVAALFEPITERSATTE